MKQHIFGMCLGLMLVAIATAGWLSSRARDSAEVAEPLADLGQVRDFTFTERSGQPVSRQDLLGKVWVASFIFTCCNQSCPQVSSTMSELHERLASEQDLRFVSFSVDPERDTPEVLRDYAKGFNADGQRWLFLTGKQDDLYSLIRDNFHLGVEQNQGAARTPGNEVTHSSRLMLVDRRGHIRGYFEGRRVDEQGQPVESIALLHARIRELLEEQP
jgi:cytochrome oxidase Cu insertion factor (SCO1/SenC/PrrC family)